MGYINVFFIKRKFNLCYHKCQLVITFLRQQQDDQAKGLNMVKNSLNTMELKYKTYPEENKLRKYYFRFFPLGKEIKIDNLHKFNKNANCCV